MSIISTKDPQNSGSKNLLFWKLTSRVLLIELTNARIRSHHHPTTNLAPREENWNYGLGLSSRLTFVKCESLGFTDQNRNSINTLRTHYHLVLIFAVKANAHQHGCSTLPAASTRSPSSPRMRWAEDSLSAHAVIRRLCPRLTSRYPLRSISYTTLTSLDKIAGSVGFPINLSSNSSGPLKPNSSN